MHGSAVHLTVARLTPARGSKFLTVLSQTAAEKPGHVLHARWRRVERCYACFWYVSDCLLSSCGFTIRIGIDWIAGYHSGTPILYCSVAFITSDGGLSMDWTELCAKLLTRLFVCTILLVLGGTSRTTPSARIVCI